MDYVKVYWLRYRQLDIFKQMMISISDVFLYHSGMECLRSDSYQLVSMDMLHLLGKTLD